MAPLGELERAVMTRLWDHGPSDVKAVHRAVGEKRGITLNTVQSTMERLFRKGLLRREKVSHAFLYAPTVSHAEYGTALVHDLMKQVGAPGAEPVLSAFVEYAARNGEENLDRLEALIAARRGKRKKEKR